MLKIDGHHGEIKWSYIPVVTFGPFKFEGDRTGGTLTAQIVRCDECRLQLGAGQLTAVVPAGRATWRWSVRDLQISGTTMTASVVRL